MLEMIPNSRPALRPPASGLGDGGIWPSRLGPAIMIAELANRQGSAVAAEP